MFVNKKLKFYLMFTFLPVFIHSGSQPLAAITVYKVMSLSIMNKQQT